MSSAVADSGTLGTSGDDGGFEVEVDASTWLGVGGLGTTTLLAARSIAEETERAQRRVEEVQATNAAQNAGGGFAAWGGG